jgi:hypothetical protein
MIAVLVVACGLALLKRWPEGLAVLVLLGLPLYGLSVLFGRIPRGHSTWRFGMSVVMLSVIMLGTGWFCGRVLIWMIEWHGGTVVPHRAWGYHATPPLYLAIPGGLTAVGLLVNVVVLGDLCCSRRQFALLPLVATFALVLACAWTGMFGWLAAEASFP